MTENLKCQSKFQRESNSPSTSNFVSLISNLFSNFKKIKLDIEPVRPPDYNSTALNRLSWDETASVWFLKTMWLSKWKASLNADEITWMWKRTRHNSVLIHFHLRATNSTNSMSLTSKHVKSFNTRSKQSSITQNFSSTDVDLISFIFIM